MNCIKRGAVILTVLLSSFINAAVAAPDEAALAEAGANEHGQSFNGVIAKTYEDSTESWPEEELLPEGTPNVLVIMLDDVGYGHLGSFGGVIETPNLDALANNGLRYANFHATALCSPSRASLLSGRNHHRIGMGAHSITSMGFPGYNGEIPLSAKSYAKHLKKAGFSNYALGKWDTVAVYEISTTGPFDRWPSGEGFDQFYGFMAAETDNYRPVLWDGHAPVVANQEPENGYHLSEDLADKAIEYITGHMSVATDKPFSMYWAPVGMHAPHHAPKEYIEPYAGKFDMGWDNMRKNIYERQIELGLLPTGTKLTERAPAMPAWDSLSVVEKKLYARQMEVFAGMLTHLDEQIGRIVSTLDRTGLLDNTFIIVTSDNGASGEGGLSGSHNEAIPLNGLEVSFDHNMKRYDGWGGPDTYPHMHAGWAWAGNTPFKHMKQLVHNGGAQVPTIIHWPNGIEPKGEIRHQYGHVVDVAPTIMDITGTEFYEEIDGIKQISVDGVSMASTFNEPGKKSSRTEQYYELWGNRAIYKDGWKAVTAHNPTPWKLSNKSDFGDDVWELYHVEEDFSESVDLANDHPDKLESLKMRWDELAWKNNVYPLYDDIVDRMAKQGERLHGDRKVFEYFWPGAVRIPEAVAAPVKGRSHTISTEINLKGDEEGVIVANGGLTGGFSLFMKGGKLHYVYNSYNDDYYVLSSDAILSGKVDIKFEMNQTEKREGVGTLYVNGNKVDEVSMPNLHVALFSVAETFDVGADYGSQVTSMYGVKGHFPFTGELDKVVVTLVD